MYESLPINSMHIESIKTSKDEDQGACMDVNMQSEACKVDYQ